jgi:hypothetical protein
LLKDEEMLHGVALLRLIEADATTDTTFHFSKGIHVSAYRITRGGVHVGVLLKVSTKRKSPWPFVFTAWELAAIGRYRKLHPRDPVFVGLVCNRDGICCTKLDAVYELLELGETLESKRIAVRRPSGGSYWLSGPHRVKAERCIPMNAWPHSLFMRNGE